MYQIRIQRKDKTQPPFYYWEVFETYEAADAKRQKMMEEDRKTGIVDDYDYDIISVNEE